MQTAHFVLVSAGILLVLLGGLFSWWAYRGSTAIVGNDYSTIKAKIKETPELRSLEKKGLSLHLVWIGLL